MSVEPDVVKASRANELLTIEEAAAVLRRSPRAVQVLIGRREIPHRRMAGTRRVLLPRDELALWLDGAQLETVESPGSRVVRVRKAA